MKASELRIGNLIKLNYDNYHALEQDGFLNDKNNIWTVKKIDEDGDVNIYNKIENLFEFENIENLEPIPLTEEWLLKFGFVYSDDSNEFLELELTRKIKLYADYSNTFSTAVLRLKENEIKIKHVHQLQNLYFALNGEELTIQS